MGLFEADAAAGLYERAATLALILAEKTVSRYTSPFSRRDFTQPQIIAILLLRGVLDHTYRDVYHFLKSSESVRHALGLRKVPHWTTLERTSNTPGMREVLERLNTELYRRLGGGDKPRVEDGVIDSTGFETSLMSAYFAKRSRKIAEFVKASIAVVRDWMLPCATITSVGASNDLKQAYELVDRMCQAVRPERLFADAGYDSERLHARCRETHGMQSIIKPVPKSPGGAIKTRYRSEMTPLPESYRKRAAVESVISAIKRVCGSQLRARSAQSLQTELLFKILGYACLKRHPSVY